jgi:hypothetical protein
MSARGLTRLSERRAMRMFFDRGIQMIPGLRELREISVLGVAKDTAVIPARDPNSDIASASLLLNPCSEFLAEDQFSLWSNEHGTGTVQLTCPALVKAVGADRGAHSTGEMRPPLAPIEAGAA